MIKISLDIKEIEKDLQALVSAGGMQKQYAKMAVKNSAQVIDDESRKRSASFPYKSDNKTETVFPFKKRIQYRKWASKKSSLRFQSKRQRPGNFWYRSSVKRVNNGVGNPSTLSHLIEDGFRHYKSGKKFPGYKIRRGAFEDKQAEALKVLERGLAYALEHAGTGVKPGLMKFKKATRP